jgi:hypothetical protein
MPSLLVPSAKEEIQLRELWASGLSAIEIGAIMGVSKHVIWRWAKWRNLPLRSFMRRGVIIHPVKTQTGKYRNCLKCRTRFETSHKNEFICRYCKDGDEWRNDENRSYACHTENEIR